MTKRRRSTPSTTAGNKAEDVGALQREIAGLRARIKVFEERYDALRDGCGKQQQQPISWKVFLGSCGDALFECNAGAEVVVIDNYKFRLCDIAVLPDSVRELRARRYSGCLDVEKLVGRGLRVLEIWSSMVLNISAVGKLTSLRTLILRGAEASDGWEQMIRSLTSLQEVELNDIKLLKDVSFLGDVRTFDSIRIVDCPHVESIGKNLAWPALMRLEIVGTSYVAGNDLMCFLEECVLLRVLRLGDCSAASGTISLKNCRRLEELCLDRVNAGVALDLGTELPSLRLVHLTNSGVTDEAVRGLACFLTLEEVVLTGSRCVTDVGPLLSLPSLRVLDINRCIHARIMAPVVCASPLERLRMHCTAVGDECVRSLCAASLVELDMRLCSALSWGATSSALARLRNLRSLFMDHMPGSSLPLLGCPLDTLGLCAGRVRDDMLNAVAGCAETLTCLRFRFSGGELDFAKLECLQGLRELCVSCPTSVRGFGVLGSFGHLEKLTLEGPFVRDEDVEALSGCCALRQLCIRGAKGLTDASPAFKVGALEDLTLGDCESLKRLCVPKNACLRCVLRLCAVPVGAECLRRLAQHRAIESLLLERCGTIHVEDVCTVNCVITDCWGLVSTMRVPHNVRVVRTPVVAAPMGLAPLWLSV